MTKTPADDDTGAVHHNNTTADASLVLFNLPSATCDTSMLEANSLNMLGMSASPHELEMNVHHNNTAQPPETARCSNSMAVTFPVPLNLSVMTAEVRGGQAVMKYHTKLFSPKGARNKAS